MRRKKSIRRKQRCLVVIGALICSLFTGVSTAKLKEVSATTTLENPVISDGVVTWDSIFFGEYVQSDVTGEEKDPIRWRVLSVEDNEALLVSDKILDVMNYNETRTRGVITWEQATIRSWLNGYGSTSNVASESYEEYNFIDTAFSESEQDAIVTSYVPNAENSNSTGTYDKIFLLSKDEMSNEAYGLNLDICTEDYSSNGFAYTDYLCEEEWDEGGIWLRGPGDVDDLMLVFWGGDDYEYDWAYTFPYGVCPAIRLDLSDTSVWEYAGEIKSHSLDEITAKKDNKFYLLGETISLEDLVVTATYSIPDFTYSEEITNYTTNIADIDMTTIGTKELIISYMDLGVERTTVVKILVSDKEPTEEELRDIQINDYLYEIMDDGTIQIVGYTGSDKKLYVPDYVDGKKVTKIGDNAFDYCVDVTSVDIPEGITSIGYCAFQGCISLTSINIPERVTSIGEYAFQDCSSLTSIDIPEGVTSIGAWVFGFCSNLTNVNISEGVTSIGAWAFGFCSNLTSINIPEGVESISHCAFEGCSNLLSVSIPESVKNIDYGAFMDCSSLTSVNIPKGVVSIGELAFEDCSSLTNVTIPESVTSIAYGAFQRCRSLTNVTIPEGVTSIESSAFGGCSGLINIIIPEGVTSIESGVFSGCSGLTNVTIPEGVTGIGSSAFSGCSGLTNVTIPEGVTSIGSSAFSGCSGLTNIIIPEGVTSIENGVFSDCSGLTNVTIPEGVTNIGSSAFNGCNGLTNVTIPEGVTSIESGVFSGCSGLTNVTIPEGVTSIGDAAFSNCSSLLNINIPHGITEISGSAFDDTPWLNTQLSNNDLLIINGILVKASQNITTIAVPNDVTSIASYAFEDCSGLKSIKIPDNVTSIGYDVFIGCDDVVIYANKGSAAERYAQYDDDDGYKWEVLPIEQYVEAPTTEHQHIFDAGTITQQPTTTTEGVKTYTCTGCGETKTESIPKVAETPATTEQPSTNNNSVAVGVSAEVSGVIYEITKCSNETKEVTCIGPVNSKKTSVVIPATVKIDGETYKVTSVADDACKNYKKLKSVTIGKNVTKIGKNAFSGCKNLKKITIKSTLLKSVGKNAIKGINKKANIKVPKKQYNKYKKLFKSKTGYKKSMKIKK